MTKIFLSDNKELKNCTFTSIFFIYSKKCLTPKITLQMSLESPIHLHMIFCNVSWSHVITPSSLIIIINGSLSFLESPSGSVMNELDILPAKKQQPFFNKNTKNEENNEI